MPGSPAGPSRPAPTPTHDVVTLIRAKRDNERPLASDEISWLLRAYLDKQVGDEQMAALLMAIFFTGLDSRELRDWTGEMIASGDRLDLSMLSDPSRAPRPTVDKHSTGGVGDKVSLILAPLVASCGAVVPMLSGRGLGHTGGTLDKLESIPGFRVNLSVTEMVAALRRAGAVIAAAGPGLAPADRELYRLRDVTGTVESIPLIASSIMSKKIAEGTSALVLDVKTGTGAFLPDAGRAIELAAVMVALGEEHGVRTRALVTRMDTPLGRAVGNALEVEEAVAALRGDGPADLMELTLALARQMLDLAGLPDADPAEAISSGRAYHAWQDMVRAQGGDPDAPLPRAEVVEGALPAPADGYLTRLDALSIGIAAWRLGAGRARKEDAVDPAAGVRLLAKPGDYVRKGQHIAQLHGDERVRSGYVLEALAEAVTVGTEPPAERGVIVKQVGY